MEKGPQHFSGVERYSRLLYQCTNSPPPPFPVRGYVGVNVDCLLARSGPDLANRQST
jgi:hypothetical protein